MPMPSFPLKHVCEPHFAASVSVHTLNKSPSSSGRQFGGEWPFGQPSHLYFEAALGSETHLPPNKHGPSSHGGVEPQTTLPVVGSTPRQRNSLQTASSDAVQTSNSGHSRQSSGGSVGKHAGPVGDAMQAALPHFRRCSGVHANSSVGSFVHRRPRLGAAMQLLVLHFF